MGPAKKLTMAFWSCATAACGGSSPPSIPSIPPAPTTTAPPTPVLQTHGSRGVLLPGEQEQYQATVPGRGDVSGEVTWDSLTPDVFGVTRGLVRARAPGVGTMRATLGELVRVDTILVAGVTPPPPAGASADGAGVVVAELRTSGDGGPRDEFVELLNASPGEVDVSGWSVAWSDASGAAGTLGNFFPGARLSPGERFLLIDVLCTDARCVERGLETHDYRFRGDLPERGGLALVDERGRIVDQVAFGAASRYQEGRPVVLARRGDESYQRVRDTGDNQADFAAGPATPEGSACRADGRCP